jgi:hypothetical protein
VFPSRVTSALYSMDPTLQVREFLLVTVQNCAATSGFYRQRKNDTGESAIEIQTLLWAMDCLRRLRPEEITDPGLIALVQTSVELDDVPIPVNKKSTAKRTAAPGRLCHGAD